MVLSQPDLRDAVKKKKIVFSPALEENQWGEASIDLRLGFSFTQLKALPGTKVSIAQGLTALGAAGFWKTMELAEFNDLGQRATFSLEPKSLVCNTRLPQWFLPCKGSKSLLPAPLGLCGQCDRYAVRPASDSREGHN